MPSAAAIAVSIVAAGAAGASTLEGAPALADAPSYRTAVAAFSARTASTHTLPTPAPSDRSTRTSPTPELSSTAITSDTPTSKPTARATAKKSVSRSLAQQRRKSAPSDGGSAGWTCAIAGCGGTFTSPFGERWGRLHAGDDFSTPIGTPLRALHTATVSAAGFDSGLGNHVELDLGNGIHAEYGHMSVLRVSVGQKLVMGETIGLSGNTGHSTGPHLHLEIHLAGKPVDPAPWLKSHSIFWRGQNVPSEPRGVPPKRRRTGLRRL